MEWLKSGRRFGKMRTGGGTMKLILKENPDVELTVTVEYPERNIQVSRIIQKLKAQEQFLIGSENGRNYRVLMSDIFYMEKYGITILQ